MLREIFLAWHQKKKETKLYCFPVFLTLLAGRREKVQQWSLGLTPAFITFRCLLYSCHSPGQFCSLQSSPCCIQQFSTICSGSACHLKTIFKFLSLLFIVGDYANSLLAEDSVWIGWHLTSPEPSPLQDAVEMQSISSMSGVRWTKRKCASVLSYNLSGWGGLQLPILQFTARILASSCIKMKGDCSVLHLCWKRLGGLLWNSISIYQPLTLLNTCPFRAGAICLPCFVSSLITKAFSTPF